MHLLQLALRLRAPWRWRRHSTSGRTKSRIRVQEEGALAAVQASFQRAPDRRCNPDTWDERLAPSVYTGTAINDNLQPVPSSSTTSAVAMSTNTS
jgi:hypothetical protein